MNYRSLREMFSIEDLLATYRSAALPPIHQMANYREVAEVLATALRRLREADASVAKADQADHPVLKRGWLDSADRHHDAAQMLVINHYYERVKN